MVHSRFAAVAGVLSEPLGAQHGPGAAGIGYDTPVAGRWPEFAAAGEANVTIRQVFCHEAGVPPDP